MVPRCLGMVSRNFPRRHFFQSGSPPAGNSDLVVFSGGLFWAFGTWRSSGPGRKTRKRNFPVLEALFFWSESPERFSSKHRNFFTFHVLADQTRADGKSRTEGYRFHFGPGQPLALRAVPGGKRKNATSPFEEEIRRGFHKVCFRQKRGDFFFRVRPLVPPAGAVRTEEA